MSDNQRYYDILNNAFLYFEHAETDAPEQDAVDQVIAAAKADERRRVLDEVTAMVRQQITDWYPAGHVALDAVVRELIDMRGDDDRD